jgi:predicted DNA-binding protein (UPF0251 family)
MPRKKCLRFIERTPAVAYFKPAGIPMRFLEEVIISLDEAEALRLSDYEKLYQEDAAGKMNVSRQTFGRIIESAHRKLADALINGKAIKIEGGNIHLQNNFFNHEKDSHTNKKPSD